MYTKDTSGCSMHVSKRSKNVIQSEADGFPLNDMEMSVVDKARKNAIFYLEDLIKFYFDGYSADEVRNDIGSELGRQLKDDLILGGIGDIFNLTKTKCLKIIEVLKIITFRRIYDKNVFAYVYPDDPEHKVHLADAFFKASELLTVDSQPGTLIHETSHFDDCLGLDDATPEDIFNGRINWDRIKGDINEQID